MFEIFKLDLDSNLPKIKSGRKADEFDVSIASG
jgi:hypothetical protein